MQTLHPSVGIFLEEVFEMKNMIKRAGAAVLAMFTAFAMIPAAGVKAAETYEEDLTVFISFTGSGAEAGDRGLIYAGPGKDSTADITAVTASAKVGALRCQILRH